MDPAQRKDENNVCNKKAPKKGGEEKKKREMKEKDGIFRESWLISTSLLKDWTIKGTQ